MQHYLVPIGTCGHCGLQDPCPLPTCKVFIGPPAELTWLACFTVHHDLILLTLLTHPATWNVSVHFLKWKNSCLKTPSGTSKIGAMAFKMTTSEFFFFILLDHTCQPGL